MWAIVPAAGKGTRIQPLAFSKELLPLWGGPGNYAGHPRAVSDHLLERLVHGGATRICFVIAQGKSDILEYHGGSAHSAALFYTVQPKPLGLCDAIFRALPLIDPSVPVLVGLPDTIWFPADALKQLPDHYLSFLLFPAEHPERFDAVVTNSTGEILEIQVKQPAAQSKWIWGAFKMPGVVLKELFDLWCSRNRADEYLGTLVTEWIRRGGKALGVRAGTEYHDIGTMQGYVEAMHVLHGAPAGRNDSHDTNAA